MIQAPTALPITPKQIEVLQALADCDGDRKAAADRLFITERTLTTHIDLTVQRLFPQKGHYKRVSMFQLVMQGIREGYISIDKTA